MGLSSIKGISRTSDCNINIWFVNVDELQYTRLELLNELETFQNFCRIWRISIAKLLAIINELAITDSSLFEYSTYGGKPYSLLIQKDALYAHKVERDGWGNCRMKEVFYDLYIVANQFVSLAFNRIAEYIVKERFPFLYKKPFTTRKPRFDENVIKAFPKKNIRMRDIKTYELGDMTIEDFVRSYTNPSYMHTTVELSNVVVYSEGQIYLTLEGEHSLYLNFDALMDKNWKAIENINVHSIPLGNNKFYDGAQKDAPYFNHPLINKLKEIIMGT